MASHIHHHMHRSGGLPAVGILLGRNGHGKWFHAFSRPPDLVHFLVAGRLHVIRGLAAVHGPLPCSVFDGVLRRRGAQRPRSGFDRTRTGSRTRPGLRQSLRNSARKLVERELHAVSRPRLQSGSSVRFAVVLRVDILLHSVRPAVSVRIVFHSHTFSPPLPTSNDRKTG